MLGTKVRLLVAAVIVAAAVLLVLRRNRPPAPSSPPPPPAPSTGQESAHGAGIDQSMAAVLALQNAPEGATPCETAYNAFKASKDVSDTEGVKAVVLRLAPRDEFLARCAQLPATTQACLTPRYMWKHRADCQRADPGESLSGMVELLRRTEPTQQLEPPPSVAGSSSSN